MIDSETGCHLWLAYFRLNSTACECVSYNAAVSTQGRSKKNPSKTGPVPRQAVPNDPPEIEDGFQPWLLYRAAWFKPYLDLLGLAALVSVPLTAVRIWAIAGFDQSVALAILANVSLSSLAVAFLLIALPSILVLVSLVIAVQIAHNPSRRSIRKLIPLSIIETYLILGSTSKFDVLYYVGGPALFMLILRLIDRKNPNAIRENRRILAAVSVALVILMATSGNMWLPPERITVDAKAQTLFVLNDSSDALVVFSPSSTSVLRIAKSRVSDRQYCTPRYFHPQLRKTGRGRPTCPKY